MGFLIVDVVAYKLRITRFSDGKLFERDIWMNRAWGCFCMVLRACRDDRQTRWQRAR